LIAKFIDTNGASIERLKILESGNDALYVPLRNNLTAVLLKFGQ
jgi:hypothetical protein